MELNLFFIISHLGYSIPVTESCWSQFIDYLNACYPDYYVQQDCAYTNFYVHGDLVGFYVVKGV